VLKTSPHRANHRFKWFAPILMLGSSLGFGQMNSGEISGSVQEATGSVLRNATVVAQNRASGKTFTVTTNGAGEYLFAQLPIGEYSLSVSAPRFKQSDLAALDVHTTDHLRRNFTLQVGDHTEVINVPDRKGNMQLESAEIRDIVGPRQLLALPLQNHQFLDLTILTAGVVRPPGGTRGDALQQAGNLINVLGQRSGHNLYLLDGVAVTDEHFNNLVVAPSIDAIAEVNLEKTSYAPEFGGKSGAVINAISKSGSNRLHGGLFEFARSSVFDARNYFDASSAPTPPFQQNQFGGNIGGPIRQNKTFFFLSYEGRKADKSLTQIFSVPTAAMRAGDFSGQSTIYDPSNIVGGQRQPFQNNRISTPFDPVATALIARIPLPNLAGVAQNLRAVGDQRINSNQYSLRFDNTFTASDTAYLRFSIFDARQRDPFGSSILQESLLPGFGRNLNTHALNGVAAWTHIFSASVLNETRFGFLTVVGGQTSPNAGDQFAAQAGLKGVTTNLLDEGFPQVSFGGQFTPAGDPALFTFRNNRDLEIYDNLIWHRAQHAIKFGGYFMGYLLRPVNPNGARGVFTFTPRWTSSSPQLSDGNAFADFLLGYPTTAQVGIGRATIDGITHWAHFYAQDNWQITSNLKLDLGLRYEFNQNMTDKSNQIAAVDTAVPGGRFVIASDAGARISAAADALLPQLPIPYIPSSQAGWNNSLLVSRPLRLAPRGGIAWNLPRLKSVVRAGAGVYANQAAYSIVTNLAQNVPFFVTKTVNTTPSVQPTVGTETALTTGALGTIGGSNLDHNFKIEYNEVWNFNLDHELSTRTIVSLMYVGSRTVHADSSTLLNVPLPGPGAVAARRPIPQLSQISDIRWNGWATYHAFTLAAKRSFGQGLLFDANWTWSHSIDDASDPGTTLNETNLPQNVYDLSAEKASSSFDHRQRFVVSFVYQLPLAAHTSGVAHALLNEWQIAGDFAAQTGAPFTVNTATDQANIGAGPSQRPNLSGNPNAGPRTAQRWFNTAAFSLPALYSFGTAPRNAVIGPGLQQLDLSLQKDIALSEATRIQLRAESFNLLNHTNFNIPNRNAFTANFGSIASSQDPREFQLAAKFVF
jgi:Carboxypeptidase regulatory-like domain